MLDKRGLLGWFGLTHLSPKLVCLLLKTPQIPLKGICTPEPVVPVHVKFLSVDLPGFTKVNNVPGSKTWFPSTINVLS